MEAAITFMVVITPLCNSPSGTYILVGFSVKTSAGRQIFHQVTLFCQVAVLRFSDRSYCLLIHGIYKQPLGNCFDMITIMVAM